MGHLIIYEQREICSDKLSPPESDCALSKIFTLNIGANLHRPSGQHQHNKHSRWQLIPGGAQTAAC